LDRIVRVNVATSSRLFPRGTGLGLKAVVAALTLAVCTAGPARAQTVPTAAPAQTAPAVQTRPLPSAPVQPSSTPQNVVPPTPAGQAPAQPGSAATPGQGAAAQSPNATPGAPPNQDEQITTLRVQANEVNLIFTVTDKKGHFVTGLNQSSFGLLDDGRPPEAVLRFTQQTNLPLRVGIMLDTSSSIRQRFQFEQDSAFEFLLQIVHRNDRAFIEGFDIQTDITQGFTNNVDMLNQGVRKLRPGGGTALFDALYKTCHEQMLTLRDPGSVRKALVLVSDGEDNYSHALESDAIKECQRADTIVYAISTDISPSRTKGDDVLRAIAEATGGQAFYPNKIEDVAVGFKNIEEELRSQYSLVYRPADFKDDGAFRTIYLQALDPRYHVRAQKGYFAPRPVGQ
jgi:VWFA-related protein